MPDHIDFLDKNTKKTPEYLETSVKRVTSQYF